MFRDDVKALQALGVDLSNYLPSAYQDQSGHYLELKAEEEESRRREYAREENAERVQRYQRARAASELRDRRRRRAGEWVFPREGVMFEMRLSGVTKQVTASQQLLMKMGMAANGNVNIQSFVKFGGVQTAFRMHCTRCGRSEDVSDPSIFAAVDSVAPQIMNFCAEHRHDDGTSQAYAAFGTVTTNPEEMLVDTGPGRRFRLDE